MARKGKVKEPKAKATNEFSFADLNKELKKIAPLGSTLDVNEFSEISEYINSGSLILNACMTGSLKKGYPNNRAVSLNGPSGVGKTFLMLNAARNFQELGYYVAWYDSENAVDKELMESFGVDPAKVWYEPSPSVEAFRTSATNLAQKLIDAKRAGKQIPKIAVFLDSAGGLASEKEIRDAADGSNKADMTRAKMFKSIFRILMAKFAEIKAPFIFSNHTYQTQEMFSQMKAGGGTGPEYSASIILFITKAKLNEKIKDDKGKKANKQLGLILTVKPNKNRFAKPNTVKIHLRFDKGMNQYVGLEQYLNWEEYGIGKGTIVPASDYKKVKGDKKDRAIEYADESTDEIFYYIPDEKGSNIAVKHLNSTVTVKDFYTPEVFTEEIVDKIDEVVKRDFSYGIDEGDFPADELFEGEVEEDGENESED
jgi:RecA/RadA recombinase